MSKKIAVTNVSVASGGHAPVNFTISANEGVPALIAKNTTTIVMGLDIPLVEKEICQIDLSDDPGVGGGTVTNIRLFYHPDC